VKYIRIHACEYIERIFASSLPYRDRKQKYLSKFYKKHGGDGKRWPLTPFPLPCALALSFPSHQDAPTPSPCWALHFITQERLMFSNPTPSELRLSPAATMSDMLSALTCCRLSLRPCTAPLSCSLQPLLKLLPLSLKASLIRFVSIFSLLLNHRNPNFEPV